MTKAMWQVRFLDENEDVIGRYVVEAKTDASASNVAKDEFVQDSGEEILYDVHFTEIDEIELLAEIEFDSFYPLRKIHEVNQGHAEESHIVVEDIHEQLYLFSHGMSSGEIGYEDWIYEPYELNEELIKRYNPTGNIKLVACHMDSMYFYDDSVLQMVNLDAKGELCDYITQKGDNFILSVYHYVVNNLKH